MAAPLLSASSSMKQRTVDFAKIQALFNVASPELQVRPAEENERRAAAFRSTRGRHPLEEWLSGAPPVSVEPFCGEVVEIVPKTRFRIRAEIVQERRRVDAGVVHVVEADPHRVIADRIHRQDGDVALSADGLALRLGMSLHLG